MLERYIIPHRNLIYSICIRYTYNRQDVEDNFSEVMVNFWKYIETYDPARPLKTWIYAVTKRLIADLNVRNDTHLPPNDNVDVRSLAATAAHRAEPSANILDEENYRDFYGDDLLRALDSLKPIYREALILQQAGYKLSEIVEICYSRGTLRTRNIETVKSRLFLAKAHMRKLITRHGEKRTK